MWTVRSLLQGAALALAGCSLGAPSADAAAPPFSVAEVADFDSPWAMDFLPGSGLPLLHTALLTERDGRMWLVNVDNGTKQPVAGVPRVKVAGQGGLGDVVARMEGLGKYRVYLSFVEEGEGDASGAAVGYGTLVLGQEQPRLEGFKIIWRQSPKVSGNGHFSHRIAFGPDGHLFISSGDRQKFDPAQDLSTNLGKIVRLTLEGEPAGALYPETPVKAQIWSYGHRNVLGLAFAPDGRLWATEMGPRGGDELNLVLAGKNYGWPRVSNGSHYDGRDIPDHKAGDGFEPPKVWWNPSISPGGLMIYTGDLFKGWKGDAIIPALSGKALIRVDIEGDRARKSDQWDMGARIRAATQGPDGSIYLLVDEDSGGKMLRLAPAE